MDPKTLSSALPLFPALARAKQHFIARQRAPPAVAPPRATTTARSGKQTLSVAKASLLQDVCDNVDADVHDLARDVDSIDAAVRSTHEQICSDLDALTAWFIAPHAPVAAPTHVLVSVPSPIDVEIDRVQGASTDTDTPLARPLEATQQDAAKTATRTTATRCTTSATRACSRVATLALTAVHAHVIQHHYRHFLYARLYPGGQLQFARTRQLCVRVALANGWRRWCSAVRRRQRCRVGLAASAKRLEDSTRVHRISAARAERVRVRDGEYAVAKRYYETRVLCVTLRTWVAALAIGRANEQNERRESTRRGSSD